jgi:sugar lactone lactonase YvrE
VLINDLAFDKRGNLYVTDSFQATIWRVPPGGGAPQVWYTDPRLDGAFGPNGVRVDPKSDRLYFSQTFDGTGKGYIYTLPIVDHPSASDLQLFRTYDPGAGPDGIAFTAASATPRRTPSSKTRSRNAGTTTPAPRSCKRPRH